MKFVTKSIGVEIITVIGSTNDGIEGHSSIFTLLMLPKMT